MKKVIGGLAALAFLFVVASCGSVSEDDVVGKWSIDASSIDITLGDGVPADIKKMVEQGKKEMMEEGKSDMESAVIEFKKGGKFSVQGESEEGTWKLDGDQLILGMEQRGKKVSVKFDVEMDGDDMKLTLTAEEVMNVLKEQGLDKMLAAQAGGDLDKMVEGTSLSFNLKKK